MVNGRIEKFYKENCLLEQAFIKDGDKTVTDIINENIAKIGENINVHVVLFATVWAKALKNAKMTS